MNKEFLTLHLDAKDPTQLLLFIQLQKLRAFKCQALLKVLVKHYWIKFLALMELTFYSWSDKGLKQEVLIVMNLKLFVIIIDIVIIIDDEKHTIEYQDK